jgi:sRNA-binding regulator protein Hfq
MAIDEHTGGTMYALFECNQGTTVKVCLRTGQEITGKIASPSQSMVALDSESGKRTFVAYKYVVTVVFDEQAPVHQKSGFR